jgi:hypothetical protein
MNKNFNVSEPTTTRVETQRPVDEADEANDANGRAHVCEIFCIVYQTQRELCAVCISCGCLPLEKAYLIGTLDRGDLRKDLTTRHDCTIRSNRSWMGMGFLRIIPLLLMREGS